MILNRRICDYIALIWFSTMHQSTMNCALIFFSFSLQINYHKLIHFYLCCFGAVSFICLYFATNNSVCRWEVITLIWWMIFCVERCVETKYIRSYNNTAKTSKIHENRNIILKDYKQNNHFQSVHLTFSGR